MRVETTDDGVRRSRGSFSLFTFLRRFHSAVPLRHLPRHHRRAGLNNNNSRRAPFKASINQLSTTVRIGYPSLHLVTHCTIANSYL
jgi:hypothetical protein